MLLLLLSHDLHTAFTGEGPAVLFILNCLFYFWAFRHQLNFWPGKELPRPREYALPLIFPLNTPGKYKSMIISYLFT